MLKIDIAEIVYRCSQGWLTCVRTAYHALVNFIFTSKWWSTGILSGSVDFHFLKKTFLPLRYWFVSVWQWYFLHLFIHSLNQYSSVRITDNWYIMRAIQSNVQQYGLGLSYEFQMDIFPFIPFTLELIVRNS